MNCTIGWDITLVNRHQMEAIAIDAGRLAGVGDGRGIGFGRFTVDEFTFRETGDKPSPLGGIASSD